MKRREFFSEYDNAKRPRSRRELHDDGWNSDDSFRKKESHKQSYVRGSSVWNEDGSHRVFGHSRTSESIYSHKSDEGSKERYAASTSEDKADSNSCQFYKDLCISYIPSRISNSDLEDGLLIEFQKYGRVSVKIINEGVNRLAYIRFVRADDAERAFKSIEDHPLLLDDRKVEVVPCFKKEFSLDRPKNIKSNQRSPSCTDTFGQHHLRSLDRYDKRSISPKPVVRTLPEYDAALYGNKHFSGKEDIRQTTKTESTAPTRVLFVGNLAPDIEKHVLEGVFGSYGKIEDVDIKHNTLRGFSKTFAFIKFSNIHSALQAKKELQHSFIGVSRCKIGFGVLDVDILREKCFVEESNSQSSEQWSSLLVKKIPQHLVVSHLYEILQDTFEGFGSMNVKITTVDGERNAYINFQYPKDAQAAFDSNQNLLLGGQLVEITSVSKSDVVQQEESHTEIDCKSVDHLTTYDQMKLDVLDEKYSKSNTPTKVLFVGHLDSSIKKHYLKHVFEKFGNVMDIDIKKTKFGNSFAFVKFQHVYSSIKAYKEMLGEKIGNCFCKLGYSQVLEEASATVENRQKKQILKDKKSVQERNNPVMALCISRIPRRISNYHLRRLLEKTYKRFTKQKHLQIQIKISGKDRIAFVNFKHSGDATKAFNANIRLNVMNKPVKVAAVSSMKRTDKPYAASSKIKEATVAPDEEILEPELDEKATRILFVGNLPLETTEKEVSTRFKKYGQIEFVTIKRTKGSKAYAFVKFINMDYAYKAKIEMNGQMFKDSKINIGYGKSSVTSCLWVGGLGSWVDAEIFRQEFGRFGEIRRIVWPKGSNFAYVQYEDNAAAEAACHKLHGWPMGGLDKRLRVDFVSVNQILNALEKMEKTYAEGDPVDDDNEPDDKDENQNQSDTGSEGSLESNIAKSESSISDKSLQNETALSTSNISENSFTKSCSGSRNPSPILAKSEKSSSYASSVHSQISDQVVVGDDESGIWAQPSDDCLIIKTPFSPVGELSQRHVERTVFVHSKEKVTDFDYHRHHQSHQREPPATRYSPSPRRVGDSLQQEIKHYRRESGLPENFPDSYKNVYERPRNANDVYERVPEFNRDNADQYRQNSVSKKYANNEEYERKNENHEHQDSDLYRRDFLEQDRTSLTNQKRSDDLRKQNIFERRYQETYEEPSQESSLGYSDKSRRTDHNHGITHSLESFIGYSDKSIGNRDTEHRAGIKTHSRESYSDKSERNGDTENRHGIKKPSQELSLGYLEKSTRYIDADQRHGIRNSSADVSKLSGSHLLDISVQMSQRLLNCNRSLQYENMTDPTISAGNRAVQESIISNNNNNRSGSTNGSRELSKIINTLPNSGSIPSDFVNPMKNFGVRSSMLHYPANQKPPFSYGDPVSGMPQTLGTRLQQPFQHTMTDHIPPSHGNVSSFVSNPGFNTVNVPKMINPVQTPPFQRGQFPSTFVQSNPARPVLQRMAPPPVSFSGTHFPDVGQCIQNSSAEGRYPMRQQPVAHQNPKRSGALPWHIQQ